VQDKGGLGNESEQGAWYENFDQIPARRQRAMRTSMFPPTLVRAPPVVNVAPHTEARLVFI
jgi:hypothetical protein